MATIEYKGAEFEYDETALKKWSFIRSMYRATTDTERTIMAAEALLVDPDGAAEKLDDSAEDMANLVSAILADVSEAAKN